MKILLTGRNGQLGFELRRSLSLLGEVCAPDSAEFNLLDEVNLRQVVRNYRPGLVVNAAAYTAVDQAETDAERAAAINSYAPGILAEEAESLGAMMVHYSTDYVFDGMKHGPYTEDDSPNPKNVYGTTKLAGELAVQSRCRRHLILRTSWVVGVHGGNFAKTILRLALEKEMLSVVADQYGAPTSAALLADLTAILARSATGQDVAGFPYGLYHAVASGETTWHEYACHVVARARAAGKCVRVASDAIRPIAAAEYPTPARRPANSRLDTYKLRSAFCLNFPTWQQGLDHILDHIL